MWILVLFFILVIISLSLKLRKKNREISYWKDKLHSDLEAQKKEYEAKTVNSQERYCATPFVAEIHRLEEQNAAMRNKLAFLMEQLEESRVELDRQKEEAHRAKNIPDGIAFAEDGMPIFWKMNYDKPYGDYTVFYSPKSKIYHVDRFCASYAAKKTHIFNVIEKGSPCKRCASGFYNFSSIPEWFTRSQD